MTVRPSSTEAARQALAFLNESGQMYAHGKERPTEVEQQGRRLLHSLALAALRVSPDDTLAREAFRAGAWFAYKRTGGTILANMDSEFEAFLAAARGDAPAAEETT